jgi:transcriptional regulator with XRE-family HTH domain
MSPLLMASKKSNDAKASPLPTPAKRRPNYWRRDITPAMAAKLRKQGLSVREISERLGMSPGSIKTRLARAGAMFPRKTRVVVEHEVLKSLRDAGWTMERIADKLGLGKSTVAKLVHEHGLPVTERAKFNPKIPFNPEVAHRMRGQGMSVKEICEKSGVTQATVYKYLSTDW